EITQLPFCLGNGVTLTSPVQRDDFFRQAVANYRDTSPQAMLTFLHVTRGEEFLRFADPHEVDFLQGVPGHAVRAVHVRMRRDWQHEEVGAVLIRMSPEGNRVLGLSHAGLRPARGK